MVTNQVSLCDTLVRLSRVITTGSLEEVAVHPVDKQLTSATSEYSLSEVTAVSCVYHCTQVPIDNSSNLRIVKGYDLFSQPLG